MATNFIEPWGSAWQGPSVQVSDLFAPEDACVSFNVGSPFFSYLVSTKNTEASAYFEAKAKEINLYLRNMEARLEEKK